MIASVKYQNRKKKVVTVIGGGTGTFVVLSGLKAYPLDLGVIVNVMDSGGSTGKLRDQLGVLPPGDLRQCLVALSEAPNLWRKLFLYRFDAGDLKGYNFGNLFLTALEKISRSYPDVIKIASFVLKIKGKVIPATYKKTNLCAQYSDGEVLRREHYIDENINTKKKIIRVFLEPKVKANPDALKRLEKSDYIIVGPGDLFTSIFPVVLVGGVKKAISSSKAKIIYNMNLMTKAGQTTDYKASDHLREFKKYIGREPNYVIINNGRIPKGILKWYQDNKEKPVSNDLAKTNFDGKIIVADVVDDKQYRQSASDSVKRSVLRHSSTKLTKIITKIIYA